jgi:hypothetical protein
LQVDGDGVGFDTFFAEDVFEGFTVFGRERRGEREEKRCEDKKKRRGGKSDVLADGKMRKRSFWGDLGVMGRDKFTLFERPP